MDFARKHNRIESIAAKSGVHFVVNTKRDNRLDELTLEAFNRVVRELLGASGVAEALTEADIDRLDSHQYVDRLFPRQETIHEGDLVVVMEAFDSLSFVYAKKGKMIDNKNGHFSHNDFIGKPFGCKIRSINNQGYGFIHLLKPTPELWARSLNHRTQIVHELDQSQIVSQLGLRPNMVVVESGTGSAAMSHAICRTIAPFGQLHTFEFNENRANLAREEIEQHGLNGICSVYHRDVCTEGFNRPARSVDAAFLDLPEPWTAVPHISASLKRSARIATYSPCMEQTHRTIEALKKHGFHSIKTMEYRFCEHYVDEVSYEGPPKAKRHRFAKHVPGEKPATEQNEGNKLAVSDTKECSLLEKNHGSPKEATEKKNILVARPFGTMRGHTAFLTFATAGNGEPTPKN